MPDYRKIRAFVLAQQLSEEVHALIPKIPARLAPGLRAQLSRSIASVCANIAEGAAQESQPSFARFLRIALGSANEAATQLRLVQSISPSVRSTAIDLKQRVNLVAAMLTRLIERMQENAARQEDRTRAERAQGGQRRYRLNDI